MLDAIETSVSKPRTPRSDVQKSVRINVQRLLLRQQRYPSPSITVTMLYLIGLGLADEADITVKGLEVVKRAERVYLEAYTSILHVEKDKLVSKPIVPMTLILTVCH